MERRAREAVDPRNGLPFRAGHEDWQMCAPVRCYLHVPVHDRQRAGMERVVAAAPAEARGRVGYGSGTKT